MNCCDYDCHQGHNCPARSATCPTHKPNAKTRTPEQIEAAGKAATARLQAALNRSHGQHSRRPRAAFESAHATNNNTAPAPTAAERAARFQAETDRQQATAPAAPATTAHNTSELPSPLEQIDVFPPPPSARGSLSYVLTAALALVGLFILLGHAAAKLEKVFA